MRALNKLQCYLLTPVFLVVWGLLLVVFHVAQVVALNLFGRKAHASCVDALNFCLLHSLWLLGARIEVHFSQKVPLGRPIIFIANHQNKLDIPGISWYLRKYSPRFVSKIELSKGIPSISYNLRHSGAALIDRNDARQALREIARLGKSIEADKCAAVIFPEGTRSPSGELQPFATAGIKVLLKNAPNALVIPIHIDGTWKLNRFGRFPMSVGESVAWSILPAIDTSGRTADEIASLAETAIRQVLLTQHSGREQLAC